MIEKVFDKTYEIRSNGVNKGALTRAANRFIAEYAEVFGKWSVSDEIKAIAEKIKQAVNTGDYEHEIEYETNGTGDKVYDKVKHTEEGHADAFWDTDEYGDPVYHITWYFYTSDYYTKCIGKEQLHAISYGDILKKTISAKGKYRYFCTQRPPSVGAIPEGFVSFDTYATGSGVVGEATYNEQPPRAELDRFGLVFDNDWEQMRLEYAEAEQ